MKSLARILKFTRQLWPLYALVSVLSVVVALLTQAVPLLTKVAIDKISGSLHQAGGAPVKPLIIIALLILLCDAGQAVVSNVSGHWGDILSIKLKKLLSGRYYAHVLKLPQSYFDNELSGTIINRLSRGVNELGNYLQFFSNNFLQLLVSTLFTVAIVAYYAWPVAILLLLLFPIYAWLTARSSSKWQRYQKQINELTDKASGRFAESINQVKVVKSFGQSRHEQQLFGDLLGQTIGLTRPQSTYWHQQDTLRRGVLAVLFFIMYAMIFVGTAQGRYSIGTMVLLLQFVQLVRLPLFSLSFYVDNTQRAIANSRDYFKVMDEVPEQADRPGAKDLKLTGGGAINFKDVSFRYDHDKPVLRNLSFTAEPGQKLALVGESGQGKTTITSLLLRFYEPQSGMITIGGQDITAVTQSSLRSNIAVVFQEPALFSGTIRENIAYARPGANQKQVEAAARAANAHEFITGFDTGYDSEIGERGLKLSGGQKQRIAIARAILKDAPILVLDEATSSLDTKSERLVQEALERLMTGRTTIIIAHRLSTIAGVDQIVTIDDGRVQESGSPEELAKTGGIYARLLALQHSGKTADKQKLHNYDIES